MYLMYNEFHVILPPPESYHYQTSAMIRNDPEKSVFVKLQWS